MKFTIINISGKIPTWILKGCDEFLKRINTHKYSCNLIEIRADKNTHKSILELMEYEAKKMQAYIPCGSFVVILDEGGLEFDSKSFAIKVEKTFLSFSHVVFIIGGANGIHPNLKNGANLIMSLSSLTFPHAMVRLIILEQLYRAITILENHPYHRE